MSGVQNRQSRRGEIKELQDSLASNNNNHKKQALRKIIDAMTRGKDVSMIFMDIIKNMNSTDLEVKKLIYLYIINYAKSQPELAILAINSFRNDAMDKNNPFVRALAIRTMGCIRVKEISEYLTDSLRRGLKDEDSYVRKTAVLTVAKLYDVSPEMVEGQGFIELLIESVEDGNAMVVSNALASLQAIQHSKGLVDQPLFTLTTTIVTKLLLALNESSEWGSIYIIDTIFYYTPKDSTETELILDRIVPRIQHQNPGLLLSAIKLLLKYMDFISDVTLMRQYARKITSPLISLINNQNEIVYIALKNMQIIAQKRPIILDKEIKPFFCKFNDPIYVKLEKIELLTLLCNNENYQQILNEFKEYINEVDIEFVKKSIRAVGRIGVKNEKAADKSVSVLQDCLKTRVNYIVQEVIVVIKDIFRKYPYKYEALLPELCENLKSLDDPEAKSSMIFIIGDYIETIENADQLLLIFMDTFPEDNCQVQMQILISVMKLLLIRPEEGQPLFMKLMEYIQNESENTDLRERMIIYQRLLQYFPEKVKSIILQEERPQLNHQTFCLEQNLLDKLTENIGSLASIYQKQPESFVKRLRDIQNQMKELNENDYQQNQQDPEELLQNNQDYQYESTYQQSQSDLQQSQLQQPNSNNIQQSNNNQNKQTNLLDDDDLLGNDDNIQIQNKNPAQQPSNIQQNMNSFEVSSHQINNELAKNIVIPLSLVMSGEQNSMNNKIKGVQIEGGVQLINSRIYLQLRVQNRSENVLCDFFININSNPFKLTSVSNQIKCESIKNQETQTMSIELDGNGVSDNNSPQMPFKIQVALKCQIDILVFSVPVSLSVVFIEQAQPIQQQQYLAYQQQFQFKKLESFILDSNVNNQLHIINNPSLLQTKLNHNHVQFLFTRTNTQGLVINSYAAVTLNNMPLLVDIIQLNNNIQFQLATPHQSLLPLFYQSLLFIITL